MTTLSDAVLAVDIETISLTDDPDFEDTSDWELLAVGLGYQPGPDADIESEVLFREGGLGIEATSNLLERVRGWCSNKKGTTVTFNGERFDKPHLQNWSKKAAERGSNGPLQIQYEILFRDHVDLKPLAKRQCEDWPGWKNHASYEEVCEWEGIDVPETRFDDYDLNAVLEQTAINEPVVEGSHLGEHLGARYVQHYTRGTTDSRECKELRQLIYEYTESDIRPLIKLARTLDST